MQLLIGMLVGVGVMFFCFSSPSALQTLVVVDDLQVRILLANALLNILFQLIHLDRSPLAVERTAEWGGKGQAEATEQGLNRRIGPRESLENALLLQERGQDRCEQHARRGHADPAEYNGGYSMSGGRLRNSHFLVVLVE